ncbi:MAG: 2-oxoacid:acceptor oxidoreductase subunit alpha [Alphaproteobacteria bacterium]|jgi:2-oxoglutarate ferredoxin oxidoreductase subunit alpha|nr:2-oxoacid:acceptor oxidoreductase subunit alpha [Alphaproteobacteria bacterium]
MATSTAVQLEPTGTRREEVESVVVRFAGDSGDGMQLTGNQFTLATALAGNDLATFPDFPAEIRAPIGTTFGVSAFQINFGARKIATAGDAPDVLVAMNPAALKVNLVDLKAGGTVIIDTGTFSARNLKKAGFEADPLEDDSLSGYQVVTIDISKLTMEAVKAHELSNKEALRSKNMWTLGLIYWLYDRDREPTANWLRGKFVNRPEIAEANIAALNAGHIFGETAELPSGLRGYTVRQAHIAPGLYRTITGAEALAWGLAAGARLANLRMVLASYPITPASTLLHILAGMKQFNIVTFQAEDEIAAVCAAIGASFAGSLGVTSSSGPGIALKGEAIGLAIGVELPLIIVNSQRAGPSTGLPTKTEQSDLYQAVYGRNADAPLVVLAASSSANCFDTGIEAVRLATKYMTPVMVLSDGYTGNASEPWLIPDFDSYTPFPVAFADQENVGPEGYLPYARDEKTLARPWARPGTPGLEHRIGGIERADGTGNISYDAENHQRMTDLRAAKINGIADDIPLQAVEQGNESGKLAVVGWGSTHGPITRAVGNMRDLGHDVSHIHLHHIWPLPKNLGGLLAGFEQILVPEMNNGQLVTLLRADFLVPAQPLNKVNGQPFKIAEIETAILSRLDGQSGDPK